MTSARKPILTVGRPVAAVLALGLLAGCSYVPDALNPVEWYQDTVDFFVSDEDAENGDSGLVADKNASQPEEFPNLASVPDAPASGGLAGDAANRRYSDEAVAGQGQAVAPLGSGTALAEAPPPPAVPAVPVTPAPSAAMSQPQPMPTTTTQPRPSLGALAAPSAAPAPMPPAMQQSFEAGLAQRLPVDGGAALPANAVMPEIGGGYGTVVISSAGIDASGDQLAASPAASMPALPSPAAASGARTFDIASVGTQPMPQSGTVKVATILFKNGSAQLTARDVSILREVRAIQQSRGGVLRVVGHASSRTRDMDPINHKMVNFQVSADRADVVAKALIKLGAAPAQVAVNAVSDTRPLYYEVMPSGEAGNRRAEIFLSY